MTTKTFDNARSVVWAGRLITLLGAGHTVGALILTRGFVDDWLAGDLWDSSLDLRAPQPILGAFFVSVASFGIPLLLVGWAITRMGHHNLIPPPLLTCALALWITACDLLGGPSPLLLAWLSILTLLIAAHRKARTATPPTLPTRTTSTPC
ncbi:hypothetical protein [Nocardia brasiliensis]